MQHLAHRGRFRRCRASAGLCGGSDSSNSLLHSPCDVLGSVSSWTLQCLGIHGLSEVWPRGIQQGCNTYDRVTPLRCKRTSRAGRDVGSFRGGPERIMQQACNHRLKSAPRPCSAGGACQTHLMEEISFFLLASGESRPSSPQTEHHPRPREVPMLTSSHLCHPDDACTGGRSIHHCVHRARARREYKDNRRHDGRESPSLDPHPHPGVNAERCPALQKAHNLFQALDCPSLPLSSAPGQ